MNRFTHLAIGKQAIVKRTPCIGKIFAFLLHVLMLGYTHASSFNKGSYLHLFPWDEIYHKVFGTTTWPHKLFNQCFDQKTFPPYS